MGKGTESCPTAAHGNPHCRRSRQRSSNGSCLAAGTTSALLARITEGRKEAPRAGAAGLRGFCPAWIPPLRLATPADRSNPSVPSGCRRQPPGFSPCSTSNNVGLSICLAAIPLGGCAQRVRARRQRASSVPRSAGGKKNKAKGKGPSIMLEPPSGTRDFFPEEMRLQRWLFDQFHKVAGLYGFAEYDAPVLEHEELYKRKAGEEITEQMYNFRDKEGAMVTLRPEMTPSLARMVLSLTQSETGTIAAVLPLKWYSVPQCWRFETTQRGRKREHYQWNMDIVGVPSIFAEVELLSAVVAFFESVGITSREVGLKVNSRKVLGAVLKAAGVPDESFAETCVIIDKLDKIGATAVEEELTKKVGLPSDVGRRIVEATTAKTLEDFAEMAGVGESEEVSELRTLFELAKDYGYADWLQFDASVVRGLAYYTGVVFEGFDRAGQLRAVCGGGRYDRLLSLYGSPKEVPCVGFGFGDCVIIELLKEKKVLPALPARVDYVVAAYSRDMSGKALQVARLLRQAGKSVDVFPAVAKKVKKAFSYADRVGAVRIAFVAPDEWEQGLVRIKDLRNFTADTPDEQKQCNVPLTDLSNVDSYFPSGAA